jgi:hypothetical protein
LPSAGPDEKTAVRKREPTPATTGFDGGAIEYELRMTLNEMDPEDTLTISLPPGNQRIPLSELLTRLFPEAEEYQLEVAALLDRGSNPDLPDIYAVFLEAFDEWRKGRCTLSFSKEHGEPVDLDNIVSDLLVPIDSSNPRASGFSTLILQVNQHYRALEYSVREGFWSSKEELLGWVRSLALLYWLDKHETQLLKGALTGANRGLKSAAADLQGRNHIAWSDDNHQMVITAQGRRFIARLVAETEAYIDLYDHFKDTLVDLDTQTVQFNSGRGVDLRVQIFLAEDLDPIRTVFLLRLYDGTLDSYVQSWDQLIEDEDFLEGLLEPVVNRSEVADGLVSWVIDCGADYIEESK